MKATTENNVHKSENNVSIDNVYNVTKLNYNVANIDNIVNTDSIVNTNNTDNLNLADDTNGSSKFSEFQFNYVQNLNLQARRRKRRSLDGNELILPLDSTFSNSSSSNSSTSNSPTSNSPTSIDSDHEKKSSDMITETSLVHKSHSDFAVTVSNIASVSKIGLDLASVISKIYLETAKFSTKAGLDIARTVTGVLSERMIQATSFEGYGGRIIGASTNLLHRTLHLAEQITLAGIGVTSETVQITLGTATESMNLIDTLFGTTDAAKALAGFVQLMKREWTFQNDDEEVQVDDPFGILLIIKSLTAWSFLQYVTRDKFERELGGWKKEKLVDFWDLCYDWVHIEPDDTLMEELELLITEEEDDEEIILINKNQKKNIVVGELTPREEASEYISKMDNEHVKRLSDLFLETSKRYSNPYLEEIQNQSEDERLFSLLHNLKRYSKFSSSAYNFKTIIKSHIPFPSPQWRQKGTLHRFAFASSTDLSSDSIVDSSHQKVTNGSSYQPTYFLIRDHATQSIILALRGTLSIYDLIVDITCEYEDFHFPEDIQRGDYTKHQVHKGMFKVAKSMATPGQSGVFEALKREMEANEGYGLILVGHSLGAGVASLLALLFASPTTRMTTRWSNLPLGRRVHAYAFATPCVMSAELSKRAKTLVTSVAYGDDVICRLSIGHVLDIRNMVRNFGKMRKEGKEGEEDIANKIIKKVIDYQSRRFGNDQKSQASKAEYESWFWEMRQNIKSQMNNPKLYPPGKVYWIVKSNRTPYCEVNDDDGNEEENISTNGGENTKSADKKNTNNNNNNNGKPYIMLEVENVDKIFQEISFSSHMAMDHFPHVYENIMKKL